MFLQVLKKYNYRNSIFQLKALHLCIDYPSTVVISVYICRVCWWTWSHFAPYHCCDESIHHASYERSDNSLNTKYWLLTDASQYKNTRLENSETDWKVPVCTQNNLSPNSTYIGSANELKRCSFAQSSVTREKSLFIVLITLICVTANTSVHQKMSCVSQFRLSCLDGCAFLGKMWQRFNYLLTSSYHRVNISNNINSYGERRAFWHIKRGQFMALSKNTRRSCFSTLHLLCSKHLNHNAWVVTKSIHPYNQKWNDDTKRY